MDISLQAIGYVKNKRAEIKDDSWGAVISEIELIDSLPPSSLDGIEAFSHLEIIFYFHKATLTITGNSHPRDNPEWPKVGIFAQRKKDRPNHIGLTTVNLIRRQGRRLIVSNLDAIDGTAILDIKPVFTEFLAKGEIRQAEWSSVLMKDYWKQVDDGSFKDEIPY